MSRSQPYDFEAVESSESITSFHTCASSAHEPDDYLAINLSPGEPAEEELTRERKAWYRRRLQDRWRCTVGGHSYCFRDNKSPVHIQLTDANLDEWADKMVFSVFQIDEFIDHSTRRSARLSFIRQRAS